MAERDSALPEGVKAAWASAASQRPRRPELNLERIIEAGLRVADADGLAAISMARVAKELGFATMSLYRHLSSKDELLLHLQDASVGPPPTSLSRGLGWREGLAVWERELLSAYLRRSWALSIPIVTPPMMPRSMEWLEWGLQIMSDTALAPMEKVSTTLLLGGYARNEATLLATMRDQVDPEAVDQTYQAGLREIVDPERFPALHGLVAAGSLFEFPTDSPTDDGDAFMLDFGLERILDGLEVLISKRRTATGR